MNLLMDIRIYTYYTDNERFFFKLVSCVCNGNYANVRREWSIRGCDCGGGGEHYMYIIF